VGCSTCCPSGMFTAGRDLSSGVLLSAMAGARGSWNCIGVAAGASLCCSGNLTMLLQASAICWLLTPPASMAGERAAGVLCIVSEALLLIPLLTGVGSATARACGTAGGVVRFTGTCATVSAAAAETTAGSLVDAACSLPMAVPALGSGPLLASGASKMLELAVGPTITALLVTGSSGVEVKRGKIAACGVLFTDGRIVPGATR